MASKTLLLALLVAFAAIGESEDAGDYWERTRQDFEKTMQHLKTMFNIPTAEEAKKYTEDFKNKLGEVAEHLQEDIKQLQESVKNNPDLQKTLKSLTDTVNEKVTELRNENPEIAQSAEKMQQQAQNVFNSLMDEVKKAEEEISKEGGIKDTVETAMKKMVDDTKTTMQNLEKHLHEHLGHTQQH